MQTVLLLIQLNNLWMNGIAFRFFITILISGLFTLQSNGQYNPDSLERVIVEAPIKKKVQILYYLSNYYIDKSPSKTIELAGMVTTGFIASIFSIIVVVICPNDKGCFSS